MAYAKQLKDYEDATEISNKSTAVAVLQLIVVGE
jgi:hypothetical protein